ncbi:hypothetical protein D3C73_1030950 [compost metagenome]
MRHQMVPAQHHALVVQGQLDQQVVVVGIEKRRAVCWAGLEVDVVVGQPHDPVDVLGYL